MLTPTLGLYLLSSYLRGFKKSDYAILSVDLVRIRPVGRHLSKVLYSTTVIPAYGITVKVAELECSFAKFYSFVFKDP